MTSSQTSASTAFKDLVNSGRCLGVWMAPVCATWSSSRRHDGQRGAPPLRDADHVMGLPGLSTKNAIKVSQANKIVHRTYQIAVSCMLQRAPFAIEICRGKLASKVLQKISNL